MMGDILDWGEEVYHKASDNKGVIKYRVIYPENYIEYGISWENEIIGHHSALELVTKEERDLIRITSND